jgi:uncharacterized glyoxalase superfamily protein PhnB
MTAESTTATIYPGLSYNDAPAAIEFLCNAFGFEQRLVVPGPDGTIMHSELSLGPSVIMVGTTRSGEGRLSPADVGGVTMGLSVHVDDPDAHYARAVAAGAEIIQELMDADYGSRGYTAKDTEGHHWHFATYRPGAWWDGAAESEA